jgi:hypothetical protein
VFPAQTTPTKGIAVTFVPSSEAAVAPERKPAAAALTQMAVLVAALATPALVPMLFQLIANMIASRRDSYIATGLDVGDFTQTPREMALGEYRPFLAGIIAFSAVMILMAVVTAVGLQNRRHWARILTAVWAGILVLPLATWAGIAVIMAIMTPVEGTDYFIGPVDPFMLNAVAGVAAFIGNLLVFCLALGRQMRRWAPQEMPAAPNGLVPPQGPPSAGSEWGHGPYQRPGAQQPPFHPGAGR